MESSIGTYTEHTLHAMLKRHITNDSTCYEIPLGRYIADVFQAGQVYEIQTRQFARLCDKLDAFLPEYDVTVVHPVIARAYVNWVDAHSGEIVSRRVVPRKRGIQDVFLELYAIRRYLTHPHLHFRFLLVETEDYKRMGGADGRQKRGAKRMDRVPTKILSEVRIHCAKELVSLLPPLPAQPFTSADYAKSTGCARAVATAALGVLYETGMVARTGKMGNAYVYTVKKEETGIC